MMSLDYVAPIFQCCWLEESHYVYLATVVLLQILAIYWHPAAVIVGTVRLGANDWLISIGVASSILVLEEGRKRLLTFLAKRSYTLKPGNLFGPNISGTIVRTRHSSRDAI
jgi:Cation transporting ATPase, C-terminus